MENKQKEVEEQKLTLQLKWELNLQPYIFQSDNASQKCHCLRPHFLQLSWTVIY